MSRELSTSNEASASSEAANNDNPLKCEFCGRQCRSKAGITMHRSRAHGVPKQTGQTASRPVMPFVCNLCDRSFASKVGLTQHRRRTHPEQYNTDKLEMIKSKQIHTAGIPPTAQTHIRVDHDDEQVVPMPVTPPANNEHHISDLINAALGMLISMEKPQFGSDQLISLCQALLSNERNQVNFYCSLENHAETNFPCLFKVSRPLHTRFRTAINRKQRRRAQYAHIQTLLHHSAKDAANTVLSGRWRTAFESTQQHTPQFYAYWQEKLSAAAHPDDRPVRAPQATNWGLIDVITEDEVRWALNGMRGSAAGVDRIKPESLLRGKVKFVSAYLNLLLACGYVPAHLNRARVTFVPKSESPESPSDYRPISVASVFVRCLNKILAKRWTSCFDRLGRQYAFLQRDGCFEATAVLHAILRHSHTHSSPAAIASIDLSKAFDSVSHDAILRAAQAFGAPELITSLIRNCYQTASAILPNGVILHPTRGVRQGDPLSPLLFIMVIDEVLELADPMINLNVQGNPVDAIAYADDLLILADSLVTLKRKTDKLTAAANLSGLSINFQKSKVINLVTSKKKRITALDCVDLPVGEKSIKALRVNEVIRFLGIDFTHLGKASINFKDRLQSYLENLNAAPLKPQQRMNMLRYNALPKLYHALCLGVVHKQTLKALDQLTRKFVRKWFRLPPDTPVAYFHAAIKSGGLGIPHYASKIPHLRWERLNRQATSPSPLLRWAATATCVAPSLKLAQAAVSVGNQTNVVRDDVRAAWEKELYTSVDGARLRNLSHCPQSNYWMTHNNRLFPGLFIRMLQMRCGLMGTKCRRARWGSVEGGVNCRGGCGRPESLKHVLQNCGLTHDNRCRRHNDTCKVIHKLLLRHRVDTLYEPRIPLQNSYCKPDLIAIKGVVALVLDVQICDPDLIQSSWESKKGKYNTDEFNESVLVHLRRLGHCVERVEHHPVVCSYNGLLYGKSSRILQHCGFSERDLGDVCVATLTGSLRTYDGYMRSTHTF